MRRALSIALCLLAVSAWADWRGAFDDAYFQKIRARGGTITKFTDAGGTNWTLHAYTNVGTTNITVPHGQLNCWILGWAGGGGSGKETSRGNGGGGAGGYIFTNMLLSGNTVITVGYGGSKGTNEMEEGTEGGNTSFGDLVANGGGRGGVYPFAGGDGGCGGGAAHNPGSSHGTGNQGFNGGNGIDVPFPFGGGGGGGAGSGGGNADATGGAGGAGLDFSEIFGTTYGDSGWFGGGGGGSMSWGGTSAGTGGQGGGGDGAFSATGNAIGGSDGLPNSGGGAGGCGHDGASGIVIVKYVTP